MEEGYCRKWLDRHRERSSTSDGNQSTMSALAFEYHRAHNSLTIASNTNNCASCHASSAPLKNVFHYRSNFTEID